MAYGQLIRDQLLPTYLYPLPGGGEGRRRCGHGYQWPCYGAPITPAPIVPVDCGKNVIDLSQKFTYTPVGDPVDLGTVARQAGCPSITEGEVALPYTSEIDLGRLASVHSY